MKTDKMIFSLDEFYLQHENKNYLITFKTSATILYAFHTYNECHKNVILGKWWK